MTAIAHTCTGPECQALRYVALQETRKESSSGQTEDMLTPLMQVINFGLFYAYVAEGNSKKLFAPLSVSLLGCQASCSGLPSSWFGC